MGIKDGVVIEERLAIIARKAYSHRLPAHVSPSVVIHDLNSLQMMCFTSLRNRSAQDYVNALGRPIMHFATRAVANPSAVEDDEGIDATPVPSVEELAAMRKETPEYFEYKTTTKNATIVYCRDDHRYVPRNREILHEARYDGKPTLTHKDIREGGYHVVDDRPLPGFDLSLEPKEDAASIRSKAAITPLIKAAYQTYGAWALCQSIGAITQSLTADTMANADHRRRVIIDSTLETFPIDDYRHKPLLELKEGWNRGPRVVRAFSLTTDEHESSLPPPSIGEADIKMVWYTEALAKDGEDVLICTSDSDIMYTLLLHADRFNKRGIRVYVDTNAPNMKESRLQRRFVSLTELHRALEAYGLSHWEGMTHASAAIVFLALVSGSDYTCNPYRIGTNAIVEQFFDKKGWRALRDLTSKDTILWEEDETRASSEDLRSLQMFHLNTSAAFDFMRLVYQKRITQATLKSRHVPAGKQLTWAEIGEFAAVQAAGKDPRLLVPSATEITAELRRVQWVIHYWANAHVARGCFPLCELEDPDGGHSIWGWSIVPETQTTGFGQDRKVKPNGGPLALLQAQRNAPHGRLTIAKALSVIQPEEATVWALAEWTARCQERVAPLIIKMPFWAD